jgi:sulfur carrier protein
MRIFVNGEATTTTHDATVAELIDQLANGWRRVAVARNGEVVPRSAWADTHLAEADRIEILAPTAGG